MLEAPSRATLDLLLTTMFWRAPAAREPEDVRDADELFAALASVSESQESAVATAEHISTWLQEARGLPAAAAERIADRFIVVSRSID